MKEQNRYSIDIYGLDNKSYEFDYELGPAFFEEMQQDLIQKGHFRVHLVLDKSSTMMHLRFKISGTVELLCDRSLEPFDESVDTEGVIILKFGDHDEELTEEIFIINRNTTRINVAGYIFEFIALSLPMKKIHPDLRSQGTEDAGDDTNETLVYSSSDTAPENDEDVKSEDTVDPRWEALKKLKK